MRSYLFSKAKVSPSLKFFGVLLFTLFWWSILSTFLSLVFQSWLSDDPHWFLTLFIIPFVIAGLSMIAATIYFFMALFTPKATVTISKQLPQLGEKVSLTWHIPHSTAINQVKIILKGEEVICAQNNDNNQNTKNTFVLQKLLDTYNQEAIHAGKIQFIIPVNTMHSFDGQKNKINWQIIIHGQIKFRPDLKHEYPIIVMPHHRNALDSGIRVQGFTFSFR